jgi:hypothetical protein
MAVGFSGSGAKLLAEHWNGTRWSTLASPPPPASRFGYLFSVSCYPGGCMAVGFATTQPAYDGSAESIAEQWDGTRWTTLSTPAPSQSYSWSLDGLSCTSSSDCMAVGSMGTQTSADGTLAEHWDGSVWTLSPPPAGQHRSGPDLEAVSCPTVGMCMAVGSDESIDDHERAFVERWNGSAWVSSQVPLLPNSQESWLNGITCRSSTDCTAVGNTDVTPDGPGFAFVEHWNGSGWTLIPTPTPG